MSKSRTGDGGVIHRVVIMTDGRSDKSPGFAEDWRGAVHETPIFGVTFGDADKSQLDRLADLTRSRVFDGGKNLNDAFRAARGYN